jgi:hypothetical protein
MAAKIFLGINAALFIVYGLMCLASPSVAADQAGIQMTTGDASAEMRAMYGGLQTAIGMLALAGTLRAELRRAVLFTFAFLFFGLASGRMIGLMLDPGVGPYSFAAFGFEVLFGILSVALLVRSSSTGGSPDVIRM